MKIIRVGLVQAMILMRAFEFSFVHAFVVCRRGGNMTPEIESDYKIFRETVKGLFEETRQFSIDEIFRILPTNQFTPVYVQFCAREIEKRGESLLSQSAIEEFFSFNQKTVQ